MLSLVQTANPSDWIETIAPIGGVRDWLTNNRTAPFGEWYSDEVSESILPKKVP